MEVLELFLDRRRVPAALLRVVAARHELHVAAGDRQRRLQVVHDAAQHSPDRGESVFGLALLSSQTGRDGCAGLPGDQGEELQVGLVEASRHALLIEPLSVEELDRSARSVVRVQRHSEHAAGVDARFLIDGAGRNLAVQIAEVRFAGAHDLHAEALCSVR